MDVIVVVAVGVDGPVIDGVWSQKVKRGGNTG